MFLDTPHHKADLAIWAKFESTIAKTIKNINSDIVFVLKPGLEMLTRVQDGFYGLLRLRRNKKLEIVVTCFFEELPLPLVGKVNFIIPACFIKRVNHFQVMEIEFVILSGYAKKLATTTFLLSKVTPYRVTAT